MDLIEPVKVIVGHDATAGQGWYLEKVVIRSENALMPSTETASQKEKLYTFLCQRFVEKDFDIVLLLLNAVSVVMRPSNSINMHTIFFFAMH